MSEQRVILVEGNDDVHAIIHVLKKRGVFVEGYVKLHDSCGWDSLISAVPVRLKSSAHKVIGIVADADNCLGSRWADICSAISPHGFGPLPANPPAGGFVASNAEGVRVGVWLMPNNLDNGALEDFLLALVDTADGVLVKATQVVSSLAATEKKFGAVAMRKAVSHTYLAWQETPGRPLGMAVNLNYFDGRSGAAKEFESWYTRLTA